MERLLDDLDRIIDRIVRNNAVLVLEQESRDWWTVTDTANRDEVMARADRQFCIRFLRAFLAKHPEATFDQSSPHDTAAEHAWMVAQDSEFLPRVGANVLPFSRMAEALDDVS